MQKFFRFFIFFSIFSFSFVQALGDTSTVASNTSTQCVPVYLSKNLSKGQSDITLNGDIFLLQTFLNDKGFFQLEPQQYATFGKITLGSVIDFQKQKYSNVSANEIDSNLVPSASDRQTLANNNFVLDPATGNVFNLTRAKIEYVSCHTNTSLSVSNNTSQTQQISTDTSITNSSLNQTTSNSAQNVFSSSQSYCTIEVDKSTCTIPFTWNINNAIFASIINSTAQPNIVYSYAASGNNVPLTIPFGTHVIQAKDNSTVLFSVSVVASCISGTSWDIGSSRCMSSYINQTTQNISTSSNLPNITCPAGTTWSTNTSGCVPNIITSNTSVISNTSITSVIPNTSSVATTLASASSSNSTVVDSGVISMYYFPAVARCPANKSVTSAVGMYSKINGDTGFFTPTINTAKTEASGGIEWSSRIKVQCEEITSQTTTQVTQSTTTVKVVTPTTTTKVVCNSEQTLVSGVCKTITVSYTCPSGKVIQVGGLLSPENKLNQCPVVGVTEIKTQGDYYNSLSSTQKASIDKYFIDQFISNPKISMTLGDVINTDAARGITRALIIPVTSVKTYGDYYYSLTLVQRAQLRIEVQRLQVITSNSQLPISQSELKQLDLNWGITR